MAALKKRKRGVSFSELTCTLGQGDAEVAAQDEDDTSTLRSFVEEAKVGFVAIYWCLNFVTGEAQKDGSTGDC